MPEVRWTGIETVSIERCSVAELDNGVRILGAIEREDGFYEYDIRATREWEFLTLTIRTSARNLHVTRTEDGWSVDGEPRPDPRGAAEIDLSASPLSNTLPIRRLGLSIGQSADITTAYVALPDFTVIVDPQRYTRLSDREYLYESRDSDFRRNIRVDESGLVVDYPGLFERQRTPRDAALAD